MLKIFNTLSRKVEGFEPINSGAANMYTCGPTVYDHMHIGNLRTFVFSDLLRRTLIANGLTVKSVQNITDIEDKIIERSKERGITPSELTEEYTKYFLEDISKLNILPADNYPKATEHVTKMVKYIEELLEKGLAYVKDGSVYFDISEFPEYGKLSQLDKRELKTGTRILSDEYSKDNVQDFALWKEVSPEEVGFDSPWGRGRPGWHIECSVMSQEYLGDTFDIHAGAVDLIFPHHENEIAQSEGKTGKPFVHYFVHGEHLLVDGRKMSKTDKNFFTLKDLEEKGAEPLALRYLFLTAIYRENQNFTWESLGAAQKTLGNLRTEIRAWESPKEVDGDFWQKFLLAANNDLNIPQAVAVLHEMVRSDIETSTKSATLLEMDKILGLGLENYIGKQVEVPVQVLELMEKRENARKSGNFAESDNLRKQIKDLGFEIEDTPSGQKVK